MKRVVNLLKKKVLQNDVKEEEEEVKDEMEVDDVAEKDKGVAIVQNLSQLDLFTFF